MASAEVVFVARVRSLEDRIPKETRDQIERRELSEDELDAIEGGVEVGVDVLRVLKGDSPNLDRFKTGYGGGDCGLPMRPGETWLIATDSSGEVGLCSATRHLRGGGRNCATDHVLDQLEVSLRAGAPIPWDELPKEIDEIGNKGADGEWYAYEGPAFCSAGRPIPRVD